MSEDETREDDCDADETRHVSNSFKQKAKRFLAVPVNAWKRLRKDPEKEALLKLLEEMEEIKLESKELCVLGAIDETVVAFQGVKNLLDAFPKRLESVSNSRAASRDASRDDSGEEQNSVEIASLLASDIKKIIEARMTRGDDDESGDESKKDFDSFVGTWEMQELHGSEKQAASNLTTSWKKLSNVKLVKAQLEHLRKNRQSPSKAQSPQAIRVPKKTRSSFELDHTQPFVNSILSAATDELGKIFEETRVPPEPAGAQKEYFEATDLVFFSEKSCIKSCCTSNCFHDFNRFHRNPDAAFLDYAKNCKRIFCPAARSSDIRMSVEAKRFLDQSHKNEALIECERDLAVSTLPLPACMMRAGYSIVTDGISWYFLRINWQWSFRTGKTAWMRQIRISPCIDVSKPRGWTELADWMVYTFVQSVKTREMQSYFHVKYPLLGGGELAVNSLLGGGSRFLTMRGALESDGSSEVVIKRVRLQPEQAIYVDRNSRNKQYLKKEIDTLTRLSNCVGVAGISPLLEPSDRAVAIENKGISLDRLGIGGKRGLVLAKIVKSCIWDVALKYLQELRIAHCDIHQANIVVLLSSNSASLVDFESATEFGKDVEHSPTRIWHPKKKNDRLPAAAESDERCLRALLACLCAKDVTDYSQRNSLVFEKCTALAEAFDGQSETGFDANFSIEM